MRYSAIHAANNTKHPMIVAEVGVRDGYNAIDMLNSMDIERIYLVDPYIVYLDGDATLDQAIQSRYYFNMFRNIKNYLSKITLVTQKSTFASALFKDEFFDYVYIDADHSYERVKEDLQYWYPKVKKNGFFGGHDINMEGVRKAVDEFSLKHKFNYVIQDIDWLITKGV